VTGASLFEELRKETTTRTAVYFFGGPPGVAEDSCARLNSAAEGMYCAGFECPGFGSIEAMSSAASIAKINDSGADLLVVALGAKKGQAWIERNRARLSVPAVSHLGAVVNFVAGTIERAPAWMQRSGLEWLWRIKQEPGLARRYLSDGVRFLSVVAMRALPHAWFNVWNRPGLREVDSSAFDVDSGGDEFSIRLRGAWVRENLGPLRECFARASLAARNIRIDLEGVSYVDSAFVGLILLLSGHCRRQGRSFSLIRAGKAVRRLLRLSCVDYLLAAEDEQRLA
jgi:N-acetylglucosaminyldiphosphoundecaprenol N-acetyl-beta-D-mannosaminyltransferase